MILSDGFAMQGGFAFSWVAGRIPLYLNLKKSRSIQRVSEPEFRRQVWCNAKTWSDEPGYQRESGWPVILTKSMTVIPLLTACSAWHSGGGFHVFH